MTLSDYLRAVLARQGRVADTVVLDMPLHALVAVHTKDGRRCFAVRINDNTLITVPHIRGAGPATVIDADNVADWSYVSPAQYV